MRDGLQMESRIFTLDEKITCFKLIERAGLKRIQIGSFVHPQKVPQMADTDQLITRVVKDAKALISALILNDRGLDRALMCGVPNVSMSASVSDAHSRKNANQSAKDALNAMVRLIQSALESKLHVRGELQCVFGCVHEGPIPEKTILSAAEKMIACGASEISLADSTGMATPVAIRKMIKRFKDEFPDTPISLHLHDTRGMGLVNLFSGYEAGVRHFDVCIGGLGGCPFLEGAAGNVAAEDTVNMLESMGIDTGIDLEKLCDVIDFYETRLERRLPGRMKNVLRSQSSHTTP